MIGYTSAIFAAFLWAFASFLFRDSGKSEHPLKLNFLKGIIALALLTFSAIILSSDFTIDKESLFLLGISGVIGIGIGDTAYFYSLKYIGVQKTLLIGVLAPIITTIIGIIFMGEVLRPIILASIGLSVFGISLVILGETNNASGQTKKGYLWAFIAVFCQALGIILSRSALQSNNIEALPSAMIRILFGIIPLLFILPFQKQSITKFNFKNIKSFSYFLLAIVFGTYLTLWLQQIAVIHINAGIAQTLLSTSPIFAAIIQIIRGKKTRIQTIIGILLTVIGVSMLF